MQKSKTKKIPFQGMHARLFSMLLLIICSVVVVICIVQSITYRRQLIQSLQYDMQNTAWSISATYGSTAYESSIRSVINSGTCRVRTQMEDGEILIDTNDLSNYIQWPSVELTTELISESLDNTPGYFFLELDDEENTHWMILGQMLAKKGDQREVLLVASDTANTILNIQQLTIIMVIVSLMIIAISFIVCWFLSNTFLRPIEEITHKAELLSEGDYSVTFPKGSYTELDTLSTVLDQSVEQFASYEQMRRDMIANLSHDMRTPLTMIKAYAEMIQNLSGDNPEKRKEHLDIIIQQSNRLSDFINASLDLAKLQSGQVELHFEDYMLDKQVAQIIDRARVSFPEYMFILNTDYNCRIHADFSRIEQIIINLLSNAMKYGHGEITIRVKKRDGIVRMEIIDNGDGIQEDQKHLIWTRYFRVNPYDKDKASAGVGLSIVKEIADLHKLSYGVNCQEGVGGWFWFDFPQA